MKTLVIGGTGTVGSEVVKALLARGVETHVMTRREDPPARLPAGARAIHGDLAQPASLAAAFAGVRRVFLLTPVSPNETSYGLAAVAAAKEAGVRRIVYMSARAPEDTQDVPMFRSKRPIEEAIGASGMEWTVLQPNSFFQNDASLQGVLLGHGIYPLPIGRRGISRVDVRDIADAAVNALTTSAHAGETYTLNGPDAQTGESVAAEFSRRLGRAVRYAGDDLDAWARSVSGFMPEWMVNDFRIMFRHYQERGAVATDAERERQARVVGHAPRPFVDYVAELASAWGREPVGSAR